MLIRIEASELPGSRCGPGPDAPDGYTGIRVGVQARRDPNTLLGIVPGDAASASWTLECTTKATEAGLDVNGPHIQGKPHQRFIYLSWLSDQGPGPLGMFRRAKLRLDDVPRELLEAAAGGRTLVGRITLTDGKGNPTCAAVRPPGIDWSVE